MRAFQDLNDILEEVIEQEEKFTGFFNAALEIVQDEHCRQMLTLLRENHVMNLQILREIKVKDYGNDEWLRNIPSCTIAEIDQVKEISDESSMDDISRIILHFEQKMKDFYSCLAEEIVTLNEKELFESLVRFKEKQIYDIQRCLESW